MKENINKEIVLNRKIVIELKYKPNPKILDLKGSIVDSIQTLNLFSPFHWEIGVTGLLLKDSNEKNASRSQVIIDISKFGFICSKIDTIESFFSNYSKLYEVVNAIVDNLIIMRIGCRIQGTYKVKSQNFESVLTSFIKVFSSEIFLTDFPVKDLRVQINYQNGMYNVGPINENDEFLKNEFQYPERIDKVGVAIDTDNFLLNSSGNEDLNKISKIKDVFTASLAVEKSLYDKMKDF